MFERFTIDDFIFSKRMISTKDERMSHARHEMSKMPDSEYGCIFRRRGSPWSAARLAAEFGSMRGSSASCLNKMLGMYLRCAGDAIPKNWKAKKASARAMTQNFYGSTAVSIDPLLSMPAPIAEASGSIAENSKNSFPLARFSSSPFA